MRRETGDDLALGVHFYNIGLSSEDYETAGGLAGSERKVSFPPPAHTHTHTPTHPHTYSAAHNTSSHPASSSCIQRGDAFFYRHSDPSVWPPGLPTDGCGCRGSSFVRKGDICAFLSRSELAGGS